MNDRSIRLDAPFYTEEELDELERRDPLAAARIARRQAELARELERARPADLETPMPGEEALRLALGEARALLARDGGDLELVGVEGRDVVVRLKGACVGCPRAPLDLKNVVETLLRRKFPQIGAVRNTF